MERKKLYHLDLKPNNILFDDCQNIFLISDFGTANYYFDQEGKKTFTYKGHTPIYASPEVLNFFFDGTKLYNPGKCDIFSLGLTFLHAYLGIKNAQDLKGLN